MDSTVFSQAYPISDCMDDLPYKDIPSLINELKNPDKVMRMEAHDVLSCIGAAAVPELAKTMANADSKLRWQIIKVFNSIQDASTIPFLLEELKDDNTEIRWAASNALINLRRQVIPPLLEALICEFDSLWLQQSAHHILRVLRDNGKLTPTEEKVYQALEDIEPTVSVPWAAAKALEALNSQTKHPLQ